MLGQQDKRTVNLQELGDSSPETENAEIPVKSGALIGDVNMPEDDGIPYIGKEKIDYRGKKEGFTGNPRQPHPFDRKSGTGKGREATKGGHGKGNWGDLRDEITG